MMNRSEEGTIQRWLYNNNTLYGVAEKNGPVAGIAVVLYRENDSGELEQVDYDTTDANGNWSFNILVNGWYTVKFFGGNFTHEDWIERIWLEYDAHSVEDDLELVYETPPVMQVTELSPRIDVNRNEISVLQFSFVQLKPTKGVLANINLFGRKNGESEWNLIATIPATGVEKIDYRYEVLLEDKPLYMDFYANYINPLGKYYKQNNVVYTTEAYNVRLDGVPDALEYIGVIDVRVTNAEGDRLNDIVKMEWSDLKKLAVTAPDMFPVQSVDAFGRTVTITREMAAKTEYYGVFMAISDKDSPPTRQYPGFVALFDMVPFDTAMYDAKGLGKDNWYEWVFMGYTSVPTFEGKVPPNKYVSFWVGFITTRTVSNVEHKEYVI